ncbi:MAG TPA: lysophospholipid acyltransferase family protein [Thermomicrobiales bacterium]|nr:lysophospholipid acyltransferase family protein [Thermomicrobiales bacterium]
MTTRAPSQASTTDAPGDRAVPPPSLGDAIGTGTGSRRETTRPTADLADPVEPPIRFTLAGGRIGVVGLREYLRTVVDAGLWLVLAPIPVRVFWRCGGRRTAVWALRVWARGVARALRLRIDLEGLERIDPGEAYVVVPLHEGFADVLALLRLPLRLRFVVRDEFAGWPLLGAFLRDTGQVLVRPEDGARAYRRMVRAAPEVFAAGESFVVFPQGSILGIETDFLRGAFGLAAALDRPLLPVALTGGHRVWEHPYTPRLRRGERMSLRVLPPVPAAEIRSRGAEAVRREVRRRLKAEALGGAMAPPRRFVPARDGYWDGYAYEIDPDFSALAAEVAARRHARAAPGPSG